MGMIYAELRGGPRDGETVTVSATSYGPPMAVQVAEIRGVSLFDSHRFIHTYVLEPGSETEHNRWSYKYESTYERP